jgi:hypothetical protein
MRMMGSFFSRKVAVGSAVVVALTLAGAAFADKEKIALTAAGNKAARAAVIQHADLGGASGWTGGAVKPDLSSEPPCANFKPKQSDLTLVGAAETRWKYTGLQFDSEAQVLATPTMVRLDWQRTVLDPRVLPCLRQTLAGALGASTTLRSFKRISIAQLATYTRAYRAMLDVTAAGTTVGVMVDVILVGRGHTEITLTTTAPALAAASVVPAELRLARLLASRAT